jgi:hypothetical protein
MPKKQDYDCTCPKCKAHLRLEMPMTATPLVNGRFPKGKTTITITTYVKKVIAVKD